MGQITETKKIMGQKTETQTTVPMKEMQTIDHNPSSVGINCKICRVTQNGPAIHKFCPQCYSDSFVPFTSMILSYFIHLKPSDLFNENGNYD